MADASGVVSCKTGCGGSNFTKNGADGLPYQNARGDSSCSDAPRVLHMSLAGCCGSGGVQQVWAQKGDLNRTYEICRNTGVGPEFALTVSYDDKLAGYTDGFMFSHWTHSGASYFRYPPGATYYMCDGNGTVAEYAPSGGNFTPGNGVFRKLNKVGSTFIETEWKDAYYVYDGAFGGGGGALLRRIADTNGNCHYFQYNVGPSEGAKLLQIDFASGRSVYFGYHPDTARLDRVDAPGGRVTYFGYENNLLSAIMGPDGCATYFGYASDHLARVQDPAGYTIYYTYDSDKLESVSLGGVGGYFMYNGFDTGTYVRDGNGDVTYYSFNADGAIVRETDPLGNNYDKAFDANYLKTAEQDRTGAVGYFGYDGNGNLIRSRDARGNATYFGFDDRHHMQSLLNADGCASYYGFDSAGNMTALQNARSYVTYFGYTRGQMIAQQDALLNVAYWGYSTAGDNTRQMDKRGNTTYFGYDAVGNRVVTQDAIGSVVYFVYDDDDHLVQRSQGVRVENYTYDCRGALVRTQAADGDVTTYDYDAWRQQIRQIAPNGLNTETAYDGEGNRTVSSQVSGATRMTTYFGFDAAGWMVAQADPLGNATYFGYDGEGRVIRQLNAARNATYFTYDGNGNRVAAVGARWPESGAASFTTYYGYDAMNRTAAVLDPLLRVTYYGYDCNSNRVRTLEPGGRASYFGFDALDRQAVMLSPVGSATYYGFDANGNQVAVLNPRGYATYFAYDELNRRVQALDALNGAAYFIYDQFGNVIQQQDVRGSWSYFTFDAQSNEMTQQINALGAAWKKCDCLDAMLPPVGGATSAPKDKFGRTQYSADGLGNRTAFQYDLNSNRVAVSSPRNFQTAFGFDALNRQDRALDAVGGTAYFGFDAAGNTIWTLDPNLHQTNFGYDRLNRNVVIEDALSNSVYFGYDIAGNRSVEMDARAHSTYFYFDAGNRLTEVRDPLGRLAHWSYDANSNLAQTIDSNGTVINFDYDPLDRRTAIKYPSEAQYFGYDAGGNLVSMSDDWGDSFFGYDALSRMTRRRTPRNTDGVFDAVYYGYDAGNNLISLQYPQDNALCQYSYDDAQRLTALTTPTDNEVAFQFDESSNLTLKVLGNGTKMYAAYDAADRVSSIRYAKDNGTPVAYFDYARDAAGNTTRIGRETDLAIYYSYDPVNRLTAEVWRKKSNNAQIYAFTYDYDATGNRLKERKETTVGTEYDSAYYVYADDNSLTKRYSQFNSFTTYYYYDDNGARTSQLDNNTDDVTTFDYYPNQMIKKITPPAGDGDPWEFFYDGQLNRYLIDKEGTPAYYMWDGLNCLETRDSNGDLTARYASGYTPIYGIGSYAEISVPDGGGTTYTPIMDHRGTVVAVLDETETVISTRDYNAYGEILSEGLDPWPIEEGYQSNWKTVKIGSKTWCLSRFRVYDPQIGAFTQRDPIGSRIPGSNLYNYAKSNSLSHVDPRGLKCCVSSFTFFQDPADRANSKVSYDNAIRPIGTIDNAAEWGFGFDLDIQLTADSDTDDCDVIRTLLSGTVDITSLNTGAHTINYLQPGDDTDDQRSQDFPPNLIVLYDSPGYQTPGQNEIVIYNAEFIVEVKDLSNSATYASLDYKLNINGRTGQNNATGTVTKVSENKTCRIDTQPNGGVAAEAQKYIGNAQQAVGNAVQQGIVAARVGIQQLIFAVLPFPAVQAQDKLIKVRKL